MSQELTLSVLRLQRLRAMYSWSSSNYLPFVGEGIGFLHLQNNSGLVHQVLLSRYFQFSSVLSLSVSDSLRPHESQQARGMYTSLLLLPGSSDLAVEFLYLLVYNWMHSYF